MIIKNSKIPPKLEFINLPTTSDNKMKKIKKELMMLSIQIRRTGLPKIQCQREILTCKISFWRFKLRRISDISGGVKSNQRLKMLMLRKKVTWHWFINNLPDLLSSTRYLVVISLINKRYLVVTLLNDSRIYLLIRKCLLLNQSKFCIQRKKSLKTTCVWTFKY